MIARRRSSAGSMRVLLLGEEEEVKAAALSLSLFPLGFISFPLSFHSALGPLQRLPGVRAIDRSQLEENKFDLIICNSTRLQGEEIESVLDLADHVVDLDSDEMVLEEAISAFMVR
eukprot:767320-Hanusia_phi.AAC.3